MSYNTNMEHFETKILKKFHISFKYKRKIKKCTLSHRTNNLVAFDTSSNLVYNNCMHLLVQINLKGACEHESKPKKKS